MRAALMALALAAGPALADFDAASYPPYERCALCHGLFGQSHLARFPHLAGQKPGYIRAQLEAFLSGARQNDGGQMAAIVTELRPEEIPVVVDWFAAQDPPPPSGTPAPAGAALTETMGCAGCHDAAGEAPHLTAQHAGYLAKQMRDFRDGLRTHSKAAGMHQAMFSAMDTEIEAIAAYLSSKDRAQ